MPHLTTMEVNSLREIIGETQLKAKKLDIYMRQVNDQELRDWCRREAQTADQGVRTLIGFLDEGVRY